MKTRKTIGIVRLVVGAACLMIPLSNGATQPLVYVSPTGGAPAGGAGHVVMAAPSGFGLVAPPIATHGVPGVLRFELARRTWISIAVHDGFGRLVTRRFAPRLPAAWPDTESWREDLHLGVRLTLGGGDGAPSMD